MFSKYRDRRLSLIPIISGQKRPVESGWQQFCDRLPTEAECDAWESQGHTSFGLTLGPASGVMAVDIDSDDPKVINAVKPSPVRKRGKKGETRFFRYNPDIPSCKVAGCIDILSHGRQTVMPRSLHPDGMHYEWLTPDTLENMCVSDLPEFSVDELNDVRRTLEPEKFESGDESGVPLTGGPWTNDDPKRLCPHGSQDRLKRIANAMIARGASPDEAVRELLRYDEENHFPAGYFKDHTRTDSFADPVSNALCFYASNLKTFNRRQVRSGQQSVMPLVSGSEILDITGLNGEPISAWKPMPMPEPIGLVKQVSDLIFKSSKYEAPSLAMAGAISICSVLIANRYKWGDVWPNLYAMGIAPTGSGKQSPIDAATRLLLQDHNTGLFGKEMVLSGQALIKGLEVQRERLDIVDECSNLFHMISHGGVFQADILPLMLKLYSRSSTVFIGPEAKGADPVRVFHPCVSSLMLTNEGDFKLSVTRNFLTGGFLPRFLTFIEHERGARQPKAHWDEVLAQDVGRTIETLMSVPIELDADPSVNRNLMCPKPTPREVRASKQALEAFELYDQELDAETEGSVSEVRRQLLTRAVQNARKLALIHGVLSSGEIQESDAKWAIGMVRALCHNVEPLYEKIMASTPSEAAIIGVIDIIRKHGSMSEAKFYEATRILTKTQRAEAVESAKIEGKIRVVSDSKGRRYEALN